ncbi:MAG: GNAT family N-acetyltransferase [Bacilli bacterium]|nr:GNAT family N-acetyltransferase [Bacilli bacterium]
MDIEIRNAIYDDKDVLNGMLEKLIKYEKELYGINVKDNFKITSFFDIKLIETNSIVLVACYNNTIIGYIYAYIDYTNKLVQDYEAFINTLYIEPDFRNKKVGTSLIEKLCEILKTKNIKYISVDNIYGNIEARSLYEKMGFKIFKENRRKEIL